MQKCSFFVDKIPPLYPFQRAWLEEEEEECEENDSEVTDARARSNGLRQQGTIDVATLRNAWVVVEQSIQGFDELFSEPVWPLNVEKIVVLGQALSPPVALKLWADDQFS